MRLSSLFKRPTEKCVLVTGSHRSGTTWVGTVLAAHQEAKFLHEPLNVSDGHPLLHGIVRHSYPYICPQNERGFLNRYRRVLQSTCQAEECHKAHECHAWTVIKDPFALFSLPWFDERFHCHSVITVRRPVSVVSSLKRLKWHFDHRHLLEQPLLMRDWLAPFRRQIETVVSGPDDDVIAQGCLLWRIIYGVVAQMKSILPRAIVVRHEDLSLDPWGGFRGLHEELCIDVGTPTENAIEFFSSSENPKEATVEPPHTVALDSRANLDNWRHRLSEYEVDRIRDLTADVAGLYYSEAELDDFAAAHPSPCDDWASGAIERTGRAHATFRPRRKVAA